MSKVISFSLWGNAPKYCVGAIRNAQLLAEIYPGWEAIFQLDAYVPMYVWDALRQIENVHVVRRLDPKTHGLVAGDWKGMFWRFEYACATGVDIMISRDCDSRLNRREAYAVNEWLQSDKGFHIMRDHPWHGSYMLGGMWGCRGFALPEFNDLMNAWKQEDRWQTDQDFLNKEIYPKIVDNAMIHASFCREEHFARDFPVPRRGTEFVGQVFDENEVTVSEHITALAKAL